MSKALMMQVLEDELQVTPQQAKRATAALIAAFAAQLRREQSLTIVGMGRFRTHKRKSYKGLNPKTGEKIRVPATATVRFKASPTFRVAIGGAKAVGPRSHAAKAAEKAAAKAAAAKPVSRKTTKPAKSVNGNGAAAPRPRGRPRIHHAFG